MKARELLAQSSKLPQDSISRIQEFAEKLRHKHIIRAFEHCPTCSEKLSFQYEALELGQKLGEKASCTKCNFELSKRAFRLQ